MLKRLAAVLMVMALLVTVPRAAFAKDVCFQSDKSPYCYRDKFATYWELNGGLPVFGYPITTARDEVNRDTGKTYLTQWAERNRFELHPENAGTSYEILLGLLGKERLAQLGRNWQSEPRESGPKSGCLWFEQTGHNVCNQSGNLGFKSYWESHGLKIDGLDTYAQSLQLFGLPLTEPKMETNAAGDTVLTQWFERARFEWHPNEVDEYKVLLGLLGSEVYAGNQTKSGKIAFSTDRTGGGDIYVIDEDGNNLTQVTSDASPEVDPTWSPDGKKIAFVRYGGGFSLIYVVDADGKNLKQLSPAKSQDFAPAWSPDGKQIAFGSYTGSSPDIMLMNADGSERVNLTNTSEIWDNNPAWSPDGKKLVFESSRDAAQDAPAATDLYIMNPDGTGIVRLTNDIQRDMEPAWSPDGKQIVFSSFDGGGVVSGDISGGDLYVMSTDGTGRKRLTADATGGRQPSWSPDGTKIVFISARNENATVELYMINADGSSVRRFTNDRYNYFNPSWVTK